MQYNESSLFDLHQSAVDAFPHTRRRQHVVAPIQISELHAVPFAGVKTLFIRCKATNEDREYLPMILFKNVVYHNQSSQKTITLRENGNKFYLEPLAFEDHNVLVRCECGDHHWRFNYFNHVDKSLYGKVRKKYEALYNPGSANPKKMPGMCKHLIAMMETIFKSDLVR